MNEPGHTRPQIVDRHSSQLRFCSGKLNTVIFRWYFFKNVHQSATRSAGYTRSLGQRNPGRMSRGTRRPSPCKWQTDPSPCCDIAAFLSLVKNKNKIVICTCTHGERWRWRYCKTDTSRSKSQRFRVSNIQECVRFNVCVLHVCSPTCRNRRVGFVLWHEVGHGFVSRGSQLTNLPRALSDQLGRPTPDNTADILHFNT